MTTIFDSSRFLGFPKNRYKLLDEVQSFLEFNGVDLGQVFEVLLNSSDGYLIYSFGDFEIQFTRGFDVWSGSQNAIQLSVELDNGKVKKNVVHEYEIKDLKLLRKNSLVSKALEHGEV
jgi:hypothetical protein